MSNFGALAVYDLENVEAYDEDERDLLLDPLDRARVEAALEASDRVVVPNRALDESYDGSGDRADAASSRPRTWFARYFDYI